MWSGFPLRAWGKWREWRLNEDVGVCVFAQYIDFLCLALSSWFWSWEAVDAAVGGHRWRSCTAAQREGEGCGRKPPGTGNELMSFWFCNEFFSANNLNTLDIKYSTALERNINKCEKISFVFLLMESKIFCDPFLKLKSRKSKLGAAAL